MRVVGMTGAAGIDEVEGAEKGGQVRAARWGLVLLLLLDIVLD